MSDHMCMNMFETMTAAGVGEGDELIITTFDNYSESFNDVILTLCKLSFVATSATNRAIYSIFHIQCL